MHTARRARTATGLAVAAVLAALATVGTACAAEPPPAPPTYRLPPETARPSERVIGPPETSDGDTRFQLVGLTTGIVSVLGSHAEWPARGEFVRIRASIVNTGRSSVLFDTARQQLFTADGTMHTPDPQAMLIKRQPGQVDLGAGVRLEFDLYFDVPKGQAPRTLKVFGGPNLYDFSDATGTDIAL